MKDLPEKFDEELNRRLFQYTEESAPGLWERIAPAILQSNQSGRLTRTFLVVILMMSLVSIKVSDSNPAAELISVSNKQEDHLAKSSHGEKNNVVGSNSSLEHGVTNLEVTMPDIKPIDPKIVLPASDVVKQKRVYYHQLDETVIPPVNGKNVSNSSAIQALKLNEDFLRMSIKLIPEVKPGLTKPGIEVVNKKSTEPGLLKRQKEEKKYRKFNMYFIAMPTFGYQRIESNDNDNILVEGIKRIPVFSMKRLGVRAEFGAELPLTGRLKAFGGLMYYQRSQTINYTERIIDTTYIYTGPDGNVTIKSEFDHLEKSYEYDLKNLGVQVGLNVLLSKNTFLQTLGTGVEFQFALNRINAHARTEGFSQPSAYVFYNLYYRLQYPAEGRLKAVLQPTLNYSLYINNQLHAPFYVKPYGLGINIGCTYNF